MITSHSDLFQDLTLRYLKDIKYMFISRAQVFNFKGEKTSIKKLTWLAQGQSALGAESRPAARYPDSQFGFAAIYHCGLYL